MPEVIEHAFALLGRRVEDHVDLQRLDPAYRLFPEPGGGVDPFDVVADPFVNAATFDALEPGAGAAIRRYVDDAGEAYRTALDHFLYTTFERPDRALSRDVLRRSGTLARLLTQTLADRSRGPSSTRCCARCWATTRCSSGRRRTACPALYSLMSHLDLGDGVHYPRGGMYTLVEALAKAAVEEGVVVRTGADVVAVEVDDAPRSVRHPRRRGVARGVRLADGTFVARRRRGVRRRPAPHRDGAAATRGTPTCPPTCGSSRGPGISALLVMAGVRGELPELRHHSLFFTRDWPGNFDAILGPGRATPPDGLRVPDVASLYVSRTTATDPTAAPPGHENLFVLVPFPADPAHRDPARRARRPRRPVPRPGRRVGRCPRPARARRRAARRRARGLRARPVGVARHRAGHGAHAAAVGDVPARCRVAPGPEPAARRRGHGPGRRAADGAHRCRARRQAAAGGDVARDRCRRRCAPGTSASALPRGLWSDVTAGRA